MIDLEETLKVKKTDEEYFLLFLTLSILTSL